MRRFAGSVTAALLAAAFAAAPAVDRARPPAPAEVGIPVATVLGPEEPPFGPTPPAAGASQERRRPVRVNPDPKNRRGDLIEISIPRQRLTFWSDGRKEMSFLISTGRPGWETPAGRFEVYAKVTNGWSRQWKVVLPYMLPFHGNYTIHELPYYPGSSWRIGGSKLGAPDSHGCVRVGVGDAARLYQRTEIGTPVWIHF